MRVCRGFPGEILSIEFRCGGVDVVDVEQGERRDLVVGVDLDDVEQIGVEPFGPLVLARETGMYEDQPLAAGGNDGPRHLRYAHIGGRPHDSDDGLGALSDAETHEWTAIVGGNVVGQHLGHRVPVAGRVDRPEPLEGSTCRVFQPWRSGD